MKEDNTSQVYRSSNEGEIFLTPATGDKIFEFLVKLEGWILTMLFRQFSAI